MSGLLTVARRELRGYFATPVATVFIVVFLALSGAMTFHFGNFFAAGQATLEGFFTWHPWLYLFLVPAVGMRLWAEERRQGTIELLMTLPLGLGALVLGKFLAAWIFTGIALALTFPMWLIVNHLGDPDNGVIAAGYVGSFLTAGAYLAIAGCISAATKNQVIAFVASCAACFLLTVSGSPIVMESVSGWAPTAVVDAVASISLLTHYQGIVRGVLSAQDVFFFLSVIALFLYATAVTVDAKKAS